MNTPLDLTEESNSRGLLFYRLIQNAIRLHPVTYQEIIRKQPHLCDVNTQVNEYKYSGEIKEKCLNKLNETCRICQKECVVNAYENDKYNRHKCYEQCLSNAEYHKEIGYADICGKCLVGLPCSIKEPK
jgi:hypothetical protein